jgi:hypothetical protein
VARPEGPAARSACEEQVPAWRIQTLCSPYGVAPPLPGAGGVSTNIDRACDPCRPACGALPYGMWWQHAALDLFMTRAPERRPARRRHRSPRAFAQQPNCMRSALKEGQKGLSFGDFAQAAFFLQKLTGDTTISRSYTRSTGPGVLDPGATPFCTIFHLGARSSLRVNCNQFHRLFGAIGHLRS